MVFQDSDVAKWIEAAAYALAAGENPELEKAVDEVIALYGESQHPDGYVDSYFTVKAPDKMWTNIREAHELYCAGHMMEAAVAYYEVTGKRSLLDIMSKNADCIYEQFMKKNTRACPGHPEVELALMRLWRATGCDKYKALAKHFVGRARPGPELLHGGGKGPRLERLDRHGRARHRLHAEHAAGARAEGRRRPRRPRRVPLHRHGGRREGDGRRRAARGLPPPLGQHHAAPHVRHGRHRLHLYGRGVHGRLRSAERHGVRRDLRLDRPDVLRKADARERAPRRVRRRDGARVPQHGARRHAARRQALLLRQPARVGAGRFGRRDHAPAGSARAPAVVRLRLLPAERRARRLLARRIRLQRERGCVLHRPVRRRYGRDAEGHRADL